LENSTQGQSDVSLSRFPDTFILSAFVLQPFREKFQNSHKGSAHYAGRTTFATATNSGTSPRNRVGDDAAPRCE
jgi:hypothetical protein